MPLFGEGAGALVVFGGVALTYVLGHGAQPPQPVATHPGVPQEYVAAFQKYGGKFCPDVTEDVLAGIANQESQFGTYQIDGVPAPGVKSGQNEAGAEGPTQILDSTWDLIRQRHSDVTGDYYDPDNAIKASAHYVCDQESDEGVGIYSALKQYGGNADWYANDVLNNAATYRAGH